MDLRTKAEIMELVEEEDIEFIRLQFTDMFGNLKNVAVTANQLEHVLDNNYVFEGSYMFGDLFEEEEDMYLYPDFETFTILPWRPQQGKVARMLCDVCDEEGKRCNFSSRAILKQVINKAKENGYTFYVDPECEFFLFHTDENGIPTTVTHEQAGYMDVGPLDLGENARREIVLSLEKMGFEIESSHHEKAPAQHEIVFQEAEPLQTADSIVTFRSAVRSIAKGFGLHATFMPKPRGDVEGSGMHLKFSVYKDGRNIFNSQSGEEIREEAKCFMGGIMKHVQAICAITNPIVNSYKRLIAGVNAPQDIAWSKKKKNTLIRVHKRTGFDTKIELRFPDSSANPYLAIALCMAAGMEGLEKKIEPGEEALVSYKGSGETKKLPDTLGMAVKYFIEDPFMKEVLGEEFTKLYADRKITEWNAYMMQVSNWELETYLSRI